MVGCYDWKDGKMRTRKGKKRRRKKAAGRYRLLSVIPRRSERTKRHHYEVIALSLMFVSFDTHIQASLIWLETMSNY